MRRRVYVFGITLSLILVFALVAFAWISVAINKYPSCITYQSDGNAQLGGKLFVEIDKYLTDRKFRGSPASNFSNKWESDSTIVQLSNDSRLWLNICTKDEESANWLETAQALQTLMRQAGWAPTATLALNPNRTACRNGNDVTLSFPVDFPATRGLVTSMGSVCNARSR